MNTPNMRDVARLADVSHGTVSHFFNHPERLSAKNRARVEAAVNELGYIRDESARQLRAGNSHTVGLSLMDGWNPFFNRLTGGIESVFREGGLDLIVANSGGSTAQEIKNLDLFASRRVTGLLAVTSNAEILDRLHQLREGGLRMVLIDQTHPDLPLPTVSVDTAAAGTLAAEHLLDRGYRRYWFVGDETVHSRARRSAFVHSVGTRGTVDVIPVEELSLAAGELVGRQLVDTPVEQRPDAVFAANDLVALGLMSIVLRHGIGVPDEIALIGVDDIDFAQHSMIPLTTVRQPAFDMGKVAAEMLIEEIRSPGLLPPRHVIYAPELVIRESS